MRSIIHLGTVDDPRVGDYAAVGDPELVRRRGLFVAEGRLVVERLVAANRHAIHSILLSEAALAAMAAIIGSVAESVPIYTCTVQEMARLTGMNIHRGCLALVRRPEARSIDAILQTAMTVVVLEGIANPDNVGGIFRNVAAFGADAVLLSPTCCDPLYRKAIRTSMGATLRVPFARFIDWPAELLQLRGAGFLVAALTPRTPSESIGEFASRRRQSRLALLFGSEGAGLTDGACKVADVRLRIPVADAVDSLNVAVAAGIALSQLVGPTE
jgi:tRNA G18 (ribose-2'-O)-methylase SpoU